MWQVPVPQVSSHYPETTDQGRSTRPLRVGVVCDLIEENWLSMDLVADMLLRYLSGENFPGVDAMCIRPRMARRFTARRLPSAGVAFNVDRIVNRYWDYPRFLRRHGESADVFHIVDHSYAQLVLELPSRRTLVTCHDVDTFRSLVEPGKEPRSFAFRAMVRRTLRGLRRAALVVCPTGATRDALIAYNLVPAERLRVVPLGAHPACRPEPDPLADLELSSILGEADPNDVDLLHVGSTIPRKRIDLLLALFARVKQQCPRARLLRVGGSFTAEQESLLDAFQLRQSVIVLPYLERHVLAALYRRVALAVLPSEREGFGLPLLEAMSCGTPVVASDLPALREVGGNVTTYRAVCDIDGWTDAVLELITERREHPARWAARRRDILGRARNFSWERYTHRMVELYQEILGGIAGGEQNAGAE